MPGRKSANVSGVSMDSQKDNIAEEMDDDNATYKFAKDEIVWAKMKFFSAWPAKVRKQPNLKTREQSASGADYAGLMPILTSQIYLRIFYRSFTHSLSAGRTTKRRSQLRLKFRSVFSTIHLQSGKSTTIKFSNSSRTTRNSQ
jgi:hypothetical protein